MWYLTYALFMAHTSVVANSHGIMIHAEHISRTFRTHRKLPGFLASVKALFSREWIDKAALTDVSLEVKEGEILGLLGANGAGKTTLVKILSGIIHPTSGEATVLGFRPWERSLEFRKQIALIMGQKAQLWWDLPAADCFQLLKDVYELELLAFREQLDELVTLLGVSHVLHIPIRNLSLGERMKMELIAALLHRPKIIFLDEPTIGLDFSAQRAVRRFLREYSQRHRPAIILTSHYMEDIQSLCERIVVLRSGSVIYDGRLDAMTSVSHAHKVVHFEVEEGQILPPSWQAGELLASENGSLSFKVEAGQVASLVGEVMRSYKVLDLRIEEEDISLVIERLMRGKAQ
jgi:ABC-2 type transport system ATP-binding protein